MNSGVSRKNAKQKLLEAEIARLQAEIDSLDTQVFGKNSDFMAGDAIVLRYRFTVVGPEYTAALVKGTEGLWVTTTAQPRPKGPDGRWVTFDQLSEHFARTEILSMLVIGKNASVADLLA